MKARSVFRRHTAFAAAVLLIFFVLSFLCSCGVSGELLASGELGDGRTASAYGGIYGVRTVIVTDAAGDEVCRLSCNVRISEPFTPDDGENYGFSVCDLDFDGVKDIRVMTERSTEGNVYACYRASADGGFYLDTVLSALRGPRWNYETGEAAVCVHEHTDFPSNPDEPPKYTDTVRVTYYAPDAEKGGKFTLVREETLTYYSETEIYCFAVSVPDEDGELAITDEKWVLPDKLDREGLSDFGW